MELQIFPRVAAYRVARSGSKNCCVDSRVVANVLPCNAVSKRVYIRLEMFSARNSSCRIRWTERIVRIFTITREILYGQF